MWGEEEDSLLFCYMRPTDASEVVCYVRRTPSELPSARDGQPADLTYIHGPWSRRPEESERARETYRTHAPQKHVARSNHSFHSQTPLPRLNVASSKLFPVLLSSYRILSFVWRWDKSEGRSGKKYIDIVSDRELQTPSQACSKNWEMWEMWKWHGRILQDSYRL